MLLSVIIPTYNRQGLLFRTLLHLACQEGSSNVETEIIVVDNGSTDPTYETVLQFKPTLPRLIYQYLPRDIDKPSCISSVRNIGIQESSGDIIIFLDCGVLVPPTFIRTIADRYIGQPNIVLVHYIVGLFASSEDNDVAIADTILPYTLLDISRSLISTFTWSDRREAVFDSVNNNLDRLPAPWTLAWGAALTVPRSLIDKAGNFDESFVGWGSEDTDFAYRLFEHGASFIAEREAIVFHVPHPTSSWEEKQIFNSRNRKRIHEKHYKLDTELYTFYPGRYYNQALARLEHLVITDVIPEYSQHLLECLVLKYIDKTEYSLLIGTDSIPVVNFLNTTHLFAHNKATYSLFCARYVDRYVDYLLGCDTPYHDGFFDSVVVTDFVRLLPRLIQGRLIQELARISHRIFLIYTEGFISPVSMFDEQPWASLSQMTSITEPLDLRLTIKENVGKYSIYTIEHMKAPSNV